ncbi:MAG: arsenic efflux protein [Desulfobulbaceae bacterium]|nr:arsenic efflux protein [Desulfobulbaceae bacterium]
MPSFLQNSLINAVMITGFVAIMMVVIEYINILSKGLWQKGLRGKRWKQYILASFLGATPGCLGAFTVVSLYSHREVTLGAVVAAMIATSGDEAFVMLSLIPGQAPFIFVLLLCLGLAAGYVTDKIFRKNRVNNVGCSQQFENHDSNTCHCFPWKNLKKQWQHCIPSRGILTITLFLFLFAIITGHLGPPSWNWLKVTLVLVSTAALFIVSTVPDHFLEQHLWNHIARNHVPRIFLWTFGALLVMHLLVDQLDLSSWLQDNQLLVLLAACLVGLIPESGPHLVFLTLYVGGNIPLSILLASSVVQDGHGMLPMLAESRLAFIKVKLVNFTVGLLLGLTGYLMGW